MKEYFNGFSTQDLVDMRRNDEKRKEKVEMKKEIERLHSIIKEVREYINKIPTQPVIRVFKKELLEILDKVSNDE